MTTLTMSQSPRQQNEFDERFLALETKAAYQEKLIHELNDVLLERGKQIDVLEKRVNHLEGVLREGPTENPGHEAPPHY